MLSDNFQQAKISNMVISAIFSGLEWTIDTFIEKFFHHHVEWQFQDDHGAWVPYGQATNTQVQDAFSNSVTSNDIEKHYSSDRDKTPMLFQSQNYQFVLDFHSMSQTNQQTRKRRTIRRLVKSSSPKPPQKSFGSYLWYFQDNHNWWIEFGQSSIRDETSHACTTSSYNIEYFFTETKGRPLVINNSRFKYNLDFKKMTQTNTNTNAVRPIGRFYVVPSISDSSSGSSSSLVNPVTGVNSQFAVLLDITDPEYTKQVIFISKTLPKCNLKNMYRVKNQYLKNAYQNKRRFFIEQYPGIHFKEMFLFHGTNFKNFQAICRENLDWRLHGSSTGQLYGRGTYFSNSAEHSSQYCRDQRTKVMFIVRVLVGRIIKGDSNTVKPPSDNSGLPYDTTVNDVRKPTIFVKYDNQEYYPVYYFEFTLN